MTTRVLVFKIKNQYLVYTYLVKYGDLVCLEQNTISTTEKNITAITHFRRVEGFKTQLVIFRLCEKHRNEGDLVGPPTRGIRSDMFRMSIGNTMTLVKLQLLQWHKRNVKLFFYLSVVLHLLCFQISKSQKLNNFGDFSAILVIFTPG